MPNNKKNAFKSVGDDYTRYVRYRREIIRHSNDALGQSKRAIFSLHRNDRKAAETAIKNAVRSFKLCDARFKVMPKLKNEGSYNAAVEEYAEALLFMQFLKTGKFGKLDRRVMGHYTYLAALSDATGEVVRYAMREATAGRYDSVDKAKAVVEEVIEFLLGLDLTGYLRQKFDQSKKNLRSLEQIMYEIKMKS